MPPAAAPIVLPPQVLEQLQGKEAQAQDLGFLRRRMGATSVTTQYGRNLAASGMRKITPAEINRLGYALFQQVHVSKNQTMDAISGLLPEANFKTGQEGQYGVEMQTYLSQASKHILALTQGNGILTVPQLVALHDARGGIDPNTQLPKQAEAPAMDVVAARVIMRATAYSDGMSAEDFAQQTQPLAELLGAQLELCQGEKPQVDHIDQAQKTLMQLQQVYSDIETLRERYEEAEDAIEDYLIKEAEKRLREAAEEHGFHSFDLDEEEDHDELLQIVQQSLREQMTTPQARASMAAQDRLAHAERALARLTDEHFNYPAGTMGLANQIVDLEERIKALGPEDQAEKDKLDKQKTELETKFEGVFDEHDLGEQRLDDIREGREAVANARKAIESPAATAPASSQQAFMQGMFQHGLAQVAAEAQQKVKRAEYKSADQAMSKNFGISKKGQGDFFGTTPVKGFEAYSASGVVVATGTNAETGEFMCKTMGTGTKDGAALMAVYAMEKAFRKPEPGKQLPPIAPAGNSDATVAAYYIADALTKYDPGKNATNPMAGRGVSTQRMKKHARRLVSFTDSENSARVVRQVLKDVQFGQRVQTNPKAMAHVLEVMFLEKTTHALDKGDKGHHGKMQTYKALQARLLEIDAMPKGPDREAALQAVLEGNYQKDLPRLADVMESVEAGTMHTRYGTGMRNDGYRRMMEDETIMAAVGEAHLESQGIRQEFDNKCKKAYEETHQAEVRSEQGDPKRSVSSAPGHRPKGPGQ